MRSTHDKIGSRPHAPSGFVPSGNWHAGMRRKNESAVLRAVLAYAPVPRAEVARLTGLSAPSVTKVTSWLIQAGFLRELPSNHHPDNGRPTVPLQLESAHHLTLGVHIGLFRTTIGVVTLDGSCIEQVELPHTNLDAETILDELVDALSDLCPRYQDAEITGIGISVGGAVDTGAGVVVEHEVLGWRNVPIIERLSPRLPYPVSVEASYRALAEAEMWFGVGREVDDFLVIFIGNVPDSATVIGRQIHHGATGRAGAVAHFPVPGCEHIVCTCGRRGCLQAATGDVAIVARADELGIPCEGSFTTLVELANSGNTAAKDLLRERACAVGRFIGALIDVIDPARVVLAGSLPLTPEFHHLIQQEALAQAHHGSLRPSDIAATLLGESSLVVSAAAPVLRTVFDDPASYTSVGRID